MSSQIFKNMQTMLMKVKGTGASAIIHGVVMAFALKQKSRKVFSLGQDKVFNKMGVTEKDTKVDATIYCLI